MKLIYLTVGWTSLALGIIGAFLPVLPTTPFVLLSAFCFSKSSKKFHDWLLSHPTFGPDIRNWQEHGVIRLKAKYSATFLIILSFSITLIFIPIPEHAKWLLVIVGVSVLTFIWSRPSLSSE